MYIIRSLEKREFTKNIFHHIKFLKLTVQYFHCLSDYFKKYKRQSSRFHCEINYLHNTQFFKDYDSLPWLVWLSWVNPLPCTKSRVQFRIRVHDQVAGSILGGGAQRNQPIKVFLSHQHFSLYFSFSFSFPLFLESIKIIFR